MSFPSISAQSKPGLMPRPAVLPPRGDYYRLRRYLVLGALGVLLLSVCFSPVPTGNWADVALLTGLTIAASLIPARLPGKHLFTVPLFPILFSIVGLYGATAAVFAAAVAVLTSGFMSLPRERRLQAKYYIPNVASIVVCVGGCALFYVIIQKLRFPGNGISPNITPDWRAWLALPVCALVAFVANALITTTLVSSYQGKRWDIIWHNNVRWMLPSAIYMAPIGFLTALLYCQSPWLGIGFVIVPVYALRMVAVTHERMMLAYKQGVELLGRIMQEAHPYTHGHLHRVAHWAMRIAEEMHLPAASMQHIEDAAILHDIGKVAVDDRVLNKVGKLSDDDWAMIRRHPVTGADLVGKMEALEKVSYWIRHHHERPDGKGYPDGLKDDELPVESCIISVVDAFDAMVGGPAKEDQRPYRQPMVQEDAISELRRHAGTQFHQGVVEIFIAILAREKELEGTDESPMPKPASADDALWLSPPPASMAQEASSMSQTAASLSLVAGG